MPLRILKTYTRTLMIIRGNVFGHHILIIHCRDIKATVFVNDYLIYIILNDRYFVENAARFCTDDYIPSKEDIIHSRATTCGIIEEKYTFRNTSFALIDVGGQRSERMKWYFYDLALLNLSYNKILYKLVIMIVLYIYISIGCLCLKAQMP